MMKSCYHYIYVAMISNPDEIFYVNEDSDVWTEFKEHYTQINFYPDDHEKVIKNYCKF